MVLIETSGLPENPMVDPGLVHAEAPTDAKNLSQEQAL